MARLKKYNRRNAPPVARQVMTAGLQYFGTVPRMAQVLGGTPEIMLDVFDELTRFTKSSLSQEESHVVLLTACREYGCPYSFAFEARVANWAQVADHLVETVARRERFFDPRLNALMDITEQMMTAAGNPDEAHVQAFYEAGFDEAQLLEVALGINVVMFWVHVSRVAGLRPDSRLLQSLGLWVYRLRAWWHRTD